MGHYRTPERLNLLEQLLDNNDFSTHYKFMRSSSTEIFDFWEIDQYYNKFGLEFSWDPYSHYHPNLQTLDNTKPVSSIPLFNNYLNECNY